VVAFVACSLAHSVVAFVACSLAHSVVASVTCSLAYSVVGPPVTQRLHHRCRQRAVAGHDDIDTRLWRHRLGNHDGDRCAVGRPSEVVEHRDCVRCRGSVDVCRAVAEPTAQRGLAGRDGVERAVVQLPEDGPCEPAVGDPPTGRLQLRDDEPLEVAPRRLRHASVAVVVPPTLCQHCALLAVDCRREETPQLSAVRVCPVGGEHARLGVAAGGLGVAGAHVVAVDEVAGGVEQVDPEAHAASPDP
jgi:hypothetical protein